MLVKRYLSKIVLYDQQQIFCKFSKMYQLKPLSFDPNCAPYPGLKNEYPCI